MSQHDLEIANQGFPATRADINNALQALASASSGATAPSTTYANQLWYDTANNILKFRNEDNDAWIDLLYLDQTNDAVARLDVDNIRIDGNTISSTDTNGNITLDPDGTGNLIVSSGNVGIGTSSPASPNKLDVVADAGDHRIAMRTQNTSGNATVEAQVNNYWSGDTYRGTAIQQYDSAATGTTAGLSNANLGVLRFQNGSAGLIYTNGLTPIVFGTGNTERMRILASGGLTFNGDTAAANALDDYEEGTWTPTIDFGGGSTGVAYAHQEGAYTKIGRHVIAHASLDLPSKGSSSGQIRFGGLPFNVAEIMSSTSLDGAGFFTYINNISGVYSIAIAAQDSTEKALVYGQTSSGGNFSTPITNSAVNNDFECRFTLIYVAG